MQAIECDAIVHDGCITVPMHLEGRRVRLLVLAEADPVADRKAALRRALERRDTVPDFVPMTRDEANQR